MVALRNSQIDPVSSDMTTPIPYDARTVARFWSKVDRRQPDECWEWLASKFVSGGYGQFRLPDRPARANRVAWEIVNGRRLLDNEQALHRCDNPACCNPAHLFVGTNRDNIDDRMGKGRSGGGRQRGYQVPSEQIMRGSSNSSARLTEDDVATILREYRRGNGVQLAARFGVSPSAISLIVRGKKWRHVKVTDAGT